MQLINYCVIRPFTEELVPVADTLATPTQVYKHTYRLDNATGEGNCSRLNNNIDELALGHALPGDLCHQGRAAAGEGVATMTLPPPLTAIDCDLRDFPFMALDVVRLRDSELTATAEADEFRSAVLLWCASWHQVPAASLPDDDKILAQYAGYGRVVKEWKKVRAVALRGWVKCADGRLYHPVVAEKANKSWLAKLNQRWKTECSRIKKHNERHPGANVPFPDFDTWMEAGYPAGQLLFVPSDNLPMSLGQTSNVTGEKYSNRQGEGKRQLTSTSKSSSQASTEVGTFRKGDHNQPQESIPPTGIVELLRNDGIEATSGDSVVRAWADDPRFNKEVLTAAITRARKCKSNEDICIAYLDKAVQTVLERQSMSAKPGSAAAPPAKVLKPQGFDPKGVDEGMDDYQTRVDAHRRRIESKAA